MGSESRLERLRLPPKRKSTLGCEVIQEPTTRREAEELREAIARSLETAVPGEAIVIASDLTDANAIIEGRGERPCKEEEDQKAQHKAPVEHTSRKRGILRASQKRHVDKELPESSDDATQAASCCDSDYSQENEAVKSHSSSDGSDLSSEDESPVQKRRKGSGRSQGGQKRPQGAIINKATMPKLARTGAKRLSQRPTPATSARPVAGKAQKASAKSSQNDSNKKSAGPGKGRQQWQTPLDERKVAQTASEPGPLCEVTNTRMPGLPTNPVSDRTCLMHGQLYLRTDLQGALTPTNSTAPDLSAPPSLPSTGRLMAPRYATGIMKHPATDLNTKKLHIPQGPAFRVPGLRRNGGVRKPAQTT
eukprot:jgi/Botrbrau1/17594/Bobra.0166s0034.2